VNGRKLVLTAKQLRSIPGHSTQLSVGRLKGMVASLLTEAGLDYALAQRDGQDLIMIEMVVPKVYQNMKRGPPKPLPAVGWRFFYDYLERRIQAVRLGITDLVEEFTANIVMQLPDGRQGTIGESVKQSIKDPAQAMLPFIQIREAEA